MNFLGNTDCSSNKPYQSFLPGEGRCFPRFMAVTEVRAWVSGAWAANKREGICGVFWRNKGATGRFMMKW